MIGVKLNEIIKKLEKEYYLCIRNCGKNVENIVKATPKEWGYNTKDIAIQIKVHRVPRSK